MWKIFFVAAFFLTACSSNQTTLYESIQKNWHYVSAKDEQGNDFKKVSSTDVMSLTSDNVKNTFKYDIEAENIHASGTWQLQDSTLVFTYALTPTDTDTSKRTVRYFKVTECSGKRLVFVENGSDFYIFRHHSMNM